ncbi:chromate transporter [Paenibacillus mucilaginosus]|uniref:Chromate efflux transporter n=3 Tax=Paenibacillus mucilaginosus TaxID=61624 RepID=H6NLB7_9BACL|nr:chromate transporter [Paenibacillus mucilaginosus]AEI41800.1 chromate efflux transporter [Paenibacillus mucilaginosus KNP414]AFC30299.1 chromate efflux transporter [Paenibacillus mucilaginosus 3016]AFH62574.1 chromate transporter [Paenibacillus mucilaginosus K02]MCG7214483.1 chromate transporter [Paenibacillus mucilaginosus]WDM30765.1 chromate transporter [Paenibacillus mucilaginosus]
MIATLWKLFFSFGTATLLGYGGGPSIIPLYEDQVVNRNQWMDTAEFGRALAFGNALPGPIATKLAAYIGYKVAGWAGGAVALAAVVLPTALLMIALAGVMLKLEGNPYVKGMIRGIQPVIFVMMAMLAYDFAKYAFQSSAGPVSFLPFAIAAGFFILVQYLQLNAVWGILLSLGIGAFFLRG